MKKTLELTLEQARQLYPNACNEFKVLLEENFGKKSLIKDVTERIKTYEDACAETGEAPIDESKMLKEGFTYDEIVYRKLKTITKALVEDWEADMTDTKVNKWFPVFKVDKGSPSGFAFLYSYFDCSSAGAGDASRLCFPSERLANYAGKQFLEFYIEFIK